MQKKVTVCVTVSGRQKNAVYFISQRRYTSAYKVVLKWTIRTLSQTQEYLRRKGIKPIRPSSQKMHKNIGCHETK